MNRVRSFNFVKPSSLKRTVGAPWFLLASCLYVFGGCSDQGLATVAVPSNPTGGAANGDNTGGDSAIAGGGSDNSGVGGEGAATGGSDNNQATGGDSNEATGGDPNEATGGEPNEATGGEPNEATGGGAAVECLNAGSGSGYCTDEGCVPECQYGDKTDPDPSGATDGMGWELQANCVVAGGDIASASTSNCEPEARSDLPEPGDGRQYKDDSGTIGECMPQCKYGDKTDPDEDGATDSYGWELQAACVVADSAAAAQGIPCVAPERTDLPEPGDGYQFLNDDQTAFGDCMPTCQYGDKTVDTSSGSNSGWGWELQATCILADSVASAQGVPCVPPERSDLPEPGDGRLFMDDGVASDCHPHCSAGGGDPDENGWGWENDATCIALDSIADAQGIPCVP